MTTGFELVVAYYFMLVLHNTSIEQIGPFSTDSACERVRQWAAHRKGTEVSECWYGPALSITRGEKK